MGAKPSILTELFFGSNAGDAQAATAYKSHLTGDIVNMIEIAESGAQTKKAASNKAAIPDVYRSSVKVVAGACCIQDPTIIVHV